MDGRRFCAGIYAASMMCFAARGQSTKPPQQPLYLPDPTPRQRDPHTQFGDDPAEKLRQLRAAALLREQNHARAVSAANDLVVLARQLQEHVEADGEASASRENALTAEKIQKTAKSMRELMQAR